MKNKELAEENLRLAYATAGRLRGCGIEYGELVSICSLGLVKAADTYDPGKGCMFSSYAITVMRNEVLQEIRREKKNACAGVSLDEELPDGRLRLETVPDARDCYAESETAGLYRSWAGTLTAQEREIFRLVALCGLSQAEAGKRMEISQPQVSRIYRRIIKRIRDMGT